MFFDIVSKLLFCVRERCGTLCMNECLWLVFDFLDIVSFYPDLNVDEKFYLMQSWLGIDRLKLFNELNDIVKAQGFVPINKCVCFYNESIPESFNNLHIIDVDHCSNEICEITRIVSENFGKRIKIVLPDIAFAKLLAASFDEKNIEYSSFFTLLYKISIEKILELDKVFNNFSQSEKLTIFDGLCSVIKHENSDSNVELVSISNPGDFDADIVICANMNVSSWKLRDIGSYWFPYDVRCSLGINNKVNCDSLFCRYLKNCECVYAIRSRKNNGANEIMSPILTKIKVLSKKKEIFLDERYIKTKLCSKQKIKKNDFNFKIPNKISDYSLEILLNDPESFYVKNILNVTPEDFCDNYSKFSNAFQNFIRLFYNDKEKSEYWLNETKKYDPIGYQKCISAKEWLESRLHIKSYNSIDLSAKLSGIDILIDAHIDRIEFDGSFWKLISFQTSDNISVKDLLYGDRTSLLTKCLIANRSEKYEFARKIHVIQIWSLSSVGNDPISISEIEISEEFLNNFEARLKNSLENLDIHMDPKLGYNKYRYFERRKK